MYYIKLQVIENYKIIEIKVSKIIEIKIYFKMIANYIYD